MKVAIIAIFVFLVAIVHTAPQRPRGSGLRHPRSRTILEATLHNLSNLKYRNRDFKTAPNNKIKIKLPKLKLRNLRTKKRKQFPPRRGRRPPPRFNRDAPPPTQAPTPPPAPLVTEAPSEPKPVVIKETPEPKTIISDPIESELDESEDGLKIFKFELSEAKPNKYPYTPVDVASKDDPTPAPSPFYYISEDGEIFPEEITNSFQEFASVSGSDDIGDLSPFSYFSKPDSTFVGNQVQYIQEDNQSVKPEAKVAEPDQPSALILEDPNGEFYTPDIPQNENQEEVVFFYEENEAKDKRSSTPPSPVSYTSYTSGGSQQQNDYLSYPSYPPLAPAPPKPKHYGFRLLSPTSSPSTPLDLANEVDSPPNTHYKRDEVASTPNLAYTPEDLQNEPQTLRTPDGQTFYLVSEVEEESQGIPKVEIPPPSSTPPPTPSPVYYKYPNEPPKQKAPKAPQLPQPQKVVYYRQEENVKSATPLPPEATTESSGAIYIQRRSTTPRVSTSTKKVVQKKTENEEVATEKSSSSLPIESKTEGFSFGFPAGMTFAVPQEFRTFLNTPPKWINMENW